MRLESLEILGRETGEDFVFRGLLVVFHSASQAA
jgi:hypothetical protein